MVVASNPLTPRAADAAKLMATKNKTTPIRQAALNSSSVRTAAGLTKPGEKKTIPSGYTPKPGTRPSGPMPYKPGGPRTSLGKAGQIQQFKKLRSGKARPSAILPGRRGRGKKVPGMRQQWQ